MLVSNLSLGVSSVYWLTLFLVGFYAGLNLIAWGMIFCFVRETKQLTLEELDRTTLLALHMVAFANALHRGL